MMKILKDFEVRRGTGQRVQEQVEAFVRHLIWTGRLLPGQRLPTTHEMSRRWRVNLVSVQKAMERLTSRGLLERKTRLGTVVKPLTIGILTGCDFAAPEQHYHRALAKALREEVEKHGWVGVVFDDIRLAEKFDRLEESEGVRRLTAELARTPFAGFLQLALTTSTWALFKRISPLPAVHCSQVYRDSDVMNDYYRFAQDAVEWLARRGMKRIEIFGFAPRDEAYQAAVAAACRFDLTPPPTTPLKGGERSLSESCRQALALLDRWKRNGGMPGALVVTDDVAMRGVAMALIQRGISSDALLVLTLANEEVLHEYGFPVIRYAFSTKRNAEHAMELLWRKLVGEPLPDRPILLAGRILETDGIPK